MSIEIPDKVIYRRNLLFTAQMAGDSKRYEDMMVLIREMVYCGDELSPAECDLMYLAYKEAFLLRRKSLRILRIRAEIAQTRNDEHLLGVILQYEDLILDEVSRIADDVIQLVDYLLQQEGLTTEAMTFFWSTKADFHRYVFEIYDQEKQSQAVHRVQYQYLKALHVGDTLQWNNETKVDLNWKYAMFLRRHLNESGKAIRLLEETIHRVKENNFDYTELARMVDTREKWIGEVLLDATPISLSSGFLFSESMFAETATSLYTETPLLLKHPEIFVLLNTADFSSKSIHFDFSEPFFD